MKKLIISALLVLPSLSIAQTEQPVEPVVVVEAPEHKAFNPRESHWLWSFGFEGMKYPVIYEFAGAENNFNPKDQEVWGGRLGFGGELYLGAGFNTTTKVEGYYMGTLFSKSETANPEVDLEFAYTKRTAQVWGFDATQSIGYLFDMKTKNIMSDMVRLTVEPFIEAGIGWGKAINRLHYKYELPSADEEFKQSVEDQLVNARFGGGVNFTSSEGFFLYLKATVNQYNITSRKSKGFSRPNGSGSTDLTGEDKNADIDPITVYAIGGGYKF